MDQKSVLSLALICIAIAGVGARSPKPSSSDASPVHSYRVATPVSSPPTLVPESSPSDHVLVESPSALAPAPSKHHAPSPSLHGSHKHSPSPSPSLDGSHKHLSKKHHAPSPSPSLHGSLKHSLKASPPSKKDKSGAESIKCLKNVLGFLALGWTTLVFIF